MNGMNDIVRMVSELVNEAEKQAEETAQIEPTLRAVSLKMILQDMQECVRCGDENGFRKLARDVFGNMRTSRFAVVVTLPKKRKENELKRIIGIFALAMVVSYVMAITFYPSDMRGVVPSILKVLSMSVTATLFCEAYYNSRKRANKAAAFALAVAVVIVFKLATKFVWSLL